MRNEHPLDLNGRKSRPFRSYFAGDGPFTGIQNFKLNTKFDVTYITLFE